MEDFFHRLNAAYIPWAGSIPDMKLIAIIRLTLLFAVPVAIYYWAFISQHREGFGRFLIAFIADFLVLAIPISVPHDVTAKAWIVTICLLLLAYLPGVHPFFVYREAGRQKRLRTGLYVLMGTLLVAGLLWS